MSEILARVVPLSDYEARCYYTRFFLWGAEYRARKETLYPLQGWRWNAAPDPFSLDQANNYFRTGAWVQYAQIWDIPYQDAYAAQSHWFLPSETPPEIDLDGPSPDYRNFGFYFLSGVILWEMHQILIAQMVNNALSVGSGGNGGQLKDFKQEA